MAPFRRPSSCLFAWLCAAALLSASLSAQVPTSRAQAMERLAQQVQAAADGLAAARQQGAPAARLQELQQQQTKLEDELTGLATGFDVHPIEAAGEREYDLQTELMRLVRPLVRALSSATEGPRRVQELEDRRDGITARLEQARQVLKGLEQERRDAAATQPDGVVARRLAAAIERWNAFATDLDNERLVTVGRLEALQAARAPVAETVQNAVADFFERRGASLLIASVACLCVLLVLRFGHRQVMRVAGRRRQSYWVRILDVALQSVAGLFAAATVLLVFYLRGDFELLALAIVFLIGVGWALTRTLPMFAEQFRLLLNAGAVREGERLVVDGLPYRVDALRLHSRLVNPELQGGVLRVPLKDLVGRASRHWHEDEPWFPTRVGEWVRFGDGAFGKVELQTPEQVVVLVEQTRRTFRTADFVAENPFNLSHGFQITVAFGVDYDLQKQSTNEVPAKMAAALRERLARAVGAPEPTRVAVEFAQAGASSLDLEARVQFPGEAAPQFGMLRRAIQRVLVDVCTEHGWTIPFPQITVHRAP